MYTNQNYYIHVVYILRQAETDREMETDRKRGREKYRHIVRWTHTERDIDRDRDRQTDRHTNRQRKRLRKREKPLDAGYNNFVHSEFRSVEYAFCSSMGRVFVVRPLPVCLPICMSACLPACLSVSLSIFSNSSSPSIDFCPYLYASDFLCKLK